MHNINTYILEKLKLDSHIQVKKAAPFKIGDIILLNDTDKYILIDFISTQESEDKIINLINKYPLNWGRWSDSVNKDKTKFNNSGKKELNKYDYIIVLKYTEHNWVDIFFYNEKVFKIIT